MSGSKEHHIGLPKKGTIIMIAVLVIMINLLFVSVGDYPEDNKIRVAVLLPFSGGFSMIPNSYFAIFFPLFLFYNYIISSEASQQMIIC